MAPNKKKKKQANNPARGFATTSIVSKSRAIEDNVLKENAIEAVGTEIANQGSPLANSSYDPTKASKDLSKLTPDELESQLEESELQLLVEKYGEKVSKDVKRQVTKLESERRLFRGHAEDLSVSWWLPEELVAICMDHLENQGYLGSSRDPYESKSIRPFLSTENLSIQIWALKRILVSLGFTQDRIWQAISFLLSNKVSQDTTVNSSNRETLWGLDECLDWLALKCTREEMPNYNTNNTKNNAEEANQPVQIEFTSEICKLNSVLWI